MGWKRGHLIWYASHITLVCGRLCTTRVIIGLSLSGLVLLTHVSFCLANVRVLDGCKYSLSCLFANERVPSGNVCCLCIALDQPTTRLSRQWYTSQDQVDLPLYMDHHRESRTAITTTDRLSYAAKAQSPSRRDISSRLRTRGLQ